jgi:uncharacterized membrane protein YraQ (UPF0718 family)
VGPLVAVVSFVCSVGNIPLAAVLWNDGISFGGAIAFIFADLIVLPILDIYRKYYGLKMAGFLFVTFYVAMGAAALAVEYVFLGLGLLPRERKAIVLEPSVHWNLTTILNVVFLAIALALVVGFFRTGGPAMLRRMSRTGAGTRSKASGIESHSSARPMAANPAREALGGLHPPRAPRHRT